MGSTELKTFIKERALGLGFSAVGISRAHSIPANAMNEWLDRNYHGRMSYMERNLERRLDPTKILPSACSIISVALNYLHPVEMPYSEPDQGVFSRYARGTDYHFLLERKLSELLGDLTGIEPETVGRIYVDTGPVMDKYWAVESGLGWLGKHTNVLSRSNGSWFFLGEIILNLDLDPDLPGSDFCGSCTRCIEACPTNAIVEPYVVDARKCLSYSTIELKEDVPQKLRRPTRNIVFGCDICQDVCPWNRNVPYSETDELREGGRDYTLKELARLSPEQFRESFRLSPVKRAKWRGLMRNVAIAMGNSLLPGMIPSLTGLLQCEDRMVRRHAAWALQQICECRQSQGESEGSS